MPVTRRFSFLEEGDVAEITRKAVHVYDVHGNKVEREITESQVTHDAGDKGAFRHYMLKEIYEQPVAIQNTLDGRIANGKVLDAAFGENAAQLLPNVEHVQIIACGTSYHAGMVSRYWFEELADVSCNVEIASEYRYRKSFVRANSLLVTISQSGETADTYAALDLCNQNDMKTCSIVNVVESSIARDSNFVLPIHCGPEIGVASTKAFMGQMLVLYILVLKLGRLREDFDKETYLDKIKELKKLPKLVEDTLLTENKIQAVSGSFTDAKGSMFLGRGFSYPIALEGALKLKELAYVHAEGYPAGEMKHGPLALIEDGMPVVVLAPRDNYYKKTISNMQEVIARGAKVLLITNKSKDEVFSENIWETILVESANDDLLPFLLTVPLQKLAYYSALKKGYDIDKPRNLAKSVTVE